MSGAWAEECDAYEMSPELETAALCIARRLYADKFHTYTPSNSIAAAGSALRGWRKAQAVQRFRCPDVPDLTTEELLHCALIHVSVALSQSHRMSSAMAVERARTAEALLRTAWKKEQAR